MSRGARLPAPDDTLTIALSLARVGWPVFPVTIYKGDDGKRHKVPAVPRGTSWVDWATTDAEKIATAWQGEQAGCWIGVHVGAASIVAGDLDVTPKNGKKSLKARGLWPMPPTFNYPTLGGGRHYLYAAPEGIELTNAQDLEYQGKRLEGVDVRGGRGLFVYYGPELTETPTLAPAPEWLLVPATPKTADRAPTADEQAWRDRLTPGEPRKKYRKLIAATDFPAGASHAPMLEVVTALVQLGTSGERGIEALLDETRTRYVGDHPDRGRDWDNALAGSIKRIGLPPVTLELSKTERKAIEERNHPKAIEAAETERKAVYVHDRIVLGEGQLTDASLAEVLAEELDGTWAHATGLGLLRYDGKKWAPAEEGELFEFVRRIMRRIRAEETKAAILRGDKKHEQDARLIESRTRIVAVARLAIGIMAERTPKPDAKPDLLNVQNGVVDLRTGKLMPHDHRHMFTRITGAEYHPDADMTLWAKALEALPPKVAAWVQVRMGQAMTGYTPDDAIMPIFEGAGENGKSTIFDGIRCSGGEFVIGISDRLMLASPGDHPTELTDLIGARLALFEELPEGRNLNVKRLKDTLGTSTLTARRMRQDNVTWRATHAIGGTTNYRPIVAETDHGTWRRLALIVFPYRYRKPGEKMETERDRRGDPRLKPYFEHTPDPGVLRWLVEGARAWYDNGRVMPAPPKRVVLDTLDWRSEADPVMSYARDRLVIEEGWAIAATDLTHDFNAYLESRSNKPWSESTIASRFRDHVDLPGVTKRQVRFGNAIRPSRPAFTFTIKPLPPGTKAWVGVRFRDEGGRVPSEAERDAEAMRDLERRVSGS